MIMLEFIIHCKNIPFLKSLGLYVRDYIEFNKGNWFFWEEIMDDSKTGSIKYKYENKLLLYY